MLLAVVSLLHAGILGETFKNPLLIQTGSSPSSVSQGDFNRDGNPDLAFIDGSGIHILLGNGNGTFQRGQNISLPLGFGGTITVADINRDGNVDLVLGGGTNQKAAVAVLLGNGDGTFGPLIVSTLQLNLNLYAAIASRLGVADFDGDGAMDICASDSQNGSVYILLGNNTGTFTLKSVLSNFSAPSDVWTGDFNGDGHVDLLVHGRLGADATVYLGNGDGTFQTGVTYGGASDAFTSIVVADMDGDGHPDMIVGTQTNFVQILHGNSDGTFATTSEGGSTLNSYPIVVAVADFNSDGLLDISVSTSNGLSILQGSGSLNYASPVSYGLGTSESTSALADFNQDGRLDFALAASDGIFVLLGKNGGKFQSYDVYDVGQPVAAITSADFNKDQHKDIAIAGLAGGPGILLGNGNGTFSLLPSSPVSGGTGSILLTGDFDGDGSADLYFTANNSAGVVQFGNGDGTFGSPVALSGFQQAGFIAANIADFNNDGRSDLVSTNYQSLDVLLGQPNRAFKLVTSTNYALQSSVTPAVGDFNKDGKQDMVIAGVTTIQVLVGNGDGTFRAGRIFNTQLPGFTNLVAPISIATGDLDRDGNLDLIMPVSYPYVAEIFYGNGDGTFQDPVVLPLERGYTAISIADLNGDNLPDLVFSDQGLISIIHNAGNRTFSGESHYVAGLVGNLVLQDFNGDGFPDIAVASSGATVAVLLNQPGGQLTTGTLTIQPEPSTFTNPVAMSLTLAPFKAGSGMPMGSVTFSIDGNPVGTALLAGTSATLSYQSSSLGPGSHAISAAYSGDSSFVPSYFAAQHQVIPIVYATTITLSAIPRTALAGHTISFHAVVKSPGQTPYGIVSFLDGVTPIGALQLDANSVAVFDTALLGPGKHSVTAHFLGNANFAPVVSSPVSVIVNIDQTTTSLIANPTSATVGATVLLTATVASSAGMPTGSVAFYDAGTFLQSIALDARGVAVAAATFSLAGTHSITANYGSNGSFASSTSSAATVIVVLGGATAGTSTNLSATANPGVARGFFLRANVIANKVTPKGDVIFLDGSLLLGTAPLDSTGNANLPSPSLGPGMHYISAFYSGDSSLSPSVSRTVTEDVPTGTADFAISLPVSSVALASTSASLQVSVTSINGFSGDVALSCATEMPQLQCSLQNQVVRGATGTSKLVVTLVSTPNDRAGLNARAFLCFAVVFGSLIFLRGRYRPINASLCILLFCLGMTVGCGAPRDMPSRKGAYSVTVTGISGQPSFVVLHRTELVVRVSIPTK